VLWRQLPTLKIKMSIEDKEYNKFVDESGSTCIKITLVSGGSELQNNARGDREWNKFLADGSIRAVSV